MPKKLLVFLFVSLLTFPAIAQTDCGPAYTVRTGDTLTRIAATCGTTVQELIRLNPGVETGIEAGQGLILPNYQEALGLPVVAVTPLSGAPETPLTVAVNGFPPYTEIRLRLGEPVRGTVDMRRVITTANGTAFADFQIPPDAQRGQTYLLIAETRDGRINARSYGVDVTFAGGNLFDTTTIYLIALGDAGANGSGIGCRDSLVPHVVPIAPTVAPLTAGLEMLLASNSRTYPGTSYYNALSASDLSVERVAVINGEAQVALRGRLEIGGQCDIPRIQAQLERIALQYYTVDRVDITINGQPLAQVLGLPATPTPPPSP